MNALSVENPKFFAIPSVATILLSGRPPGAGRPAEKSPKGRGPSQVVAKSARILQQCPDKLSSDRARPGDIAVDNTDPVFLTIAPKKQRAADDIAPLALKGLPGPLRKPRAPTQEKWRELMSGDGAAFQLPKHPGWSDCFATLGLAPARSLKRSRTFLASGRYKHFAIAARDSISNPWT